MDSCAQLLAVAEHSLIPARARSTGRQLRKADCQSVRAHVKTRPLVVMLELEVVSLCGASLLLPLLIPPICESSFGWVGR